MSGHTHHHLTKPPSTAATTTAAPTTAAAATTSDATTTATATTPSDTTTASSSAPGFGEVIGWIGDTPIPRERLDRRLADLRTGPLNAALPVPGSSEDRQLSRWLTQVILTEALCEATARTLGLTPLEGPPLDRLAAVELGSINAAAYNGSPWVRAVFEHVTATAEIPPEWLPAASSEPPTPRHLVRHRLFTDLASAEEATLDDLEALGPVDLGTLPAAVAQALRRHPYGTLVGPVRDSLGWHLATALPAPPPAATPPVQARTPLLEAARRRVFARRLDELRAEMIKLVPGLEHPGDPRQPDNHHKH